MRKVRLAFSVNEREVVKGDVVSVLDFGERPWLRLTNNKEYEVKGISQTNNLVVENDDKELTEYDPIFFQ